MVQAPVEAPFGSAKGCPITPHIDVAVAVIQEHNTVAGSPDGDFIRTGRFVHHFFNNLHPERSTVFTLPNVVAPVLPV